MATLTNAQYANNDKVFKMSCELCALPATSRQASKFRRKVGTAYIYKDVAVFLVKEEEARSKED